MDLRGRVPVGCGLGVLARSFGVSTRVIVRSLQGCPSYLTYQCARGVASARSAGDERREWRAIIDVIHALLRHLYKRLPFQVWHEPRASFSVSTLCCEDGPQALNLHATQVRYLLSRPSSVRSALVFSSLQKPILIWIHFTPLSFGDTTLSPPAVRAHQSNPPLIYKTRALLRSFS